MKNTGEVWVVDMGPHYIFLSDWLVYTANKDGLKKRCQINFHPEAETAIDLLPAPIKKFARLVDGALGNDYKAGKIFFPVHNQHAWGNLAMRPWALASQHNRCNSRKVVDRGLKKWSRQAPDFRELYDKIYKQYPRAENALARYYQVNFKKSPKEAAKMAKEMLDLAFRKYFVFPRGH